MKQLQELIQEKLRLSKKLSKNIFKLPDWEDFVNLIKNCNEDIYLDKLCDSTGLSLKNNFIVNSNNVDPTYIYYDDGSVMLCYYDPIKDDDNFTELEDFYDIKRLFNEKNYSLEKIIDYINEL